MIAVEEEFNISPKHIKSEFRAKVKKNKRKLEKYKNELIKFEELLEGLFDKENANNKLSHRMSSLKNLGELNLHSLHYSQINSVKNNAKKICSTAKDFISKLEVDMKSTPLIDKNDPAYIHYLNFNQAKIELKKVKKGNMFKIFIVIILAIVIVGSIIYLVLKKSGGDKINLNEN